MRLLTEDRHHDHRQHTGREGRGRDELAYYTGNRLKKKRQEAMIKDEHTQTHARRRKRSAEILFMAVGRNFLVMNVVSVCEDKQKGKTSCFTAGKLPTGRHRKRLEIAERGKRKYLE